MAGMASQGDQFPNFIPRELTKNGQEVLSSSSYKRMNQGSGDDIDHSRRSSSESGFSDTNMSPMEQLERANMNSVSPEENLVFDISKLQLGDPRDAVPSQMYTNQWDHPYLWTETITNTSREVPGFKIPTPLLGGFEAKPKNIVTATVSDPSVETKDEKNASLPEKSLEDWLMTRLQQKNGEAFLNYSSCSPPSFPGQVSPSDEISKRLHVSNIPFRYRELNLYYMFEQFGEVTDVEIIYNDKGSKGFGFVTLSKGRDADRAQFKLHGSTVEGRVIEVNLATQKVVPSCKIRPPISPLSTSWQFNNPSPVLPGRRFPALYTSNTQQPPATLLEAQTRLAEAQLAVLQMQQKMLQDQYRGDKPEMMDQLGGRMRKNEVVGTTGGWQ
eukprot:GFUD01017058.1.p1 GENE.GFUD01017058.1~~GFUD01017058.1.p1  ORF type:complete len:385 (-),score=100.32 GFUD01017058.1:269-1423(-)